MLIKIFLLAAVVANSTGESAGSSSCPSQRIFSGPYVNEQYRFSFEVPPGLTATWNSGACAIADDGCVCMGDHGRFIELPTGGIDVYASWAVEPAGLAEGGEGPRVGTESDTSSVTVGGAPAVRSIERTVVDGELRHREKWLVLRDGIEYSVTMSCAGASMASCRRALEQVLATWSFLEQR